MCNQNSCFGGSSCCWIIIAIILLFLFIAVVPGIQLTLPGIVECPQCHEKKLAHRVCKNCGYYKGVQVIDMTEKQEKA